MCVNEWHLRMCDQYQIIDQWKSIKFELLGQDGPFYILRDFIKNISFLSLEIESVLEYNVDPDEKSFVIVPVYLKLI